MTLAEQTAVIDRWANCRCSCCRPPTQPGCRCYKGPDGTWKVTLPVSDGCDDPTPKDRKDNRKGRKNR